MNMEPRREVNFLVWVSLAGAPDPPYSPRNTQIKASPPVPDVHEYQDWGPRQTPLLSSAFLYRLLSKPRQRPVLNK